MDQQQVPRVPSGAVPRRSAFPIVIGILVGAAVGFGIGSAVYLLVNPILEDSSGLLRESQGLLWNLVPLLTLVGGVLGWWFVASRRRRQDRRGTGQDRRGTGQDRRGT